MNFQLDEATLAAMTREARICFLDEDAPGYLQALEAGLQQRHDSPDFTTMLRAAHSLKGCAGLAQLPSLRELSHKLEDLLQALENGQMPDRDEGWALLEWGVLEVATLLNQARTTDDAIADSTLMQALAAIAPTEASEMPVLHPEQPSFNPLVKTALTQDLENCFLRVEQLAADAPSEEISDCLETFFDECLLLGETLDLPWLIAGIEPLEAILEQASPEDALAIARQMIIQLRQQREEYLTQKAVISDQLSVISYQLEDRGHNLPQLRMPLQRLEGMTNHVEELMLTQERLRLQQKQLDQANRRLRQIVRQFEPIREQVQSVYDQLAIAPLNSSIAVGAGLSAHSSAPEFDAMELDRYTALHSSLQTFQELMLQVQETRADLDLVNRGFSEDLEQVHSHLDSLYSDVTQSRLVPFRLLAQRFFPQLQQLNRRYGKSADLLIQGEEVLVDQVLLEQLQTPLTHLLNNAFDHGIEMPSERLAQGKAETAQILLQASIENNHLVIRLSDDGRGINLQRVYQRARERGLCLLETPMEQYSQEQILAWIFQPNFSTAETVSELSGRGVGLDIVRSQIMRARGTVQVETELSQGTTFTLKLPLNLSLMSLLLVQLERRIIAIPSTSVLETLPYSELQWLTSDSPMVQWHQTSIPVIPWSQLLPCPQMPMEAAHPRVGMVLAGASGTFMVMANALISEQQLIIRPFDDTVVTPPSLAGCTILGSGEVVPVILPQALEPQANTFSQQPTTTVSSKTTTILVVEDSVASRNLLERLLEEIGYQAILCRDGQEALDKLSQRRGQIDLIISDVEMPRLNGFELLQALRIDRDWQHIPVVMITSRTGERHRQQALQLGANAYLGKPIQFQELLVTLQSLLALTKQV